MILHLFLLTLTSSFIFKQNSYNETLSKIYVTYAAVAFCSPECIEEWSCKTTKNSPFLTDVSYITSELTKAVAYVGYSPQNKEIIISWRGSNNADNWIEDFTFVLEPYRCRGCYIHVGFHQDYLSLSKKLIEKTQQILNKYQVKKIVCTGHSLGAALSSINGIQFALKYGDKTEIVVHNFGSPRIGNQNLAQFINSKIKQHQRVVHYRDIVPHLPPDFMDYWHAAVEIFFDKQMKEYKVCNDSGEDKKCSDKYFPDYNPADHDLYFMQISSVQC